MGEQGSTIIGVVDEVSKYDEYFLGNIISAYA